MQEVGGNFAPLTTYRRFDPNENRVFVIQAPSNSRASVYDERNLLFQRTASANTRPVLGLYSPSDPTIFDRPNGAGTVQSVFTYNYDGNRNLIESVDAEFIGGDLSSVAGIGDVTRTSFDGFDRPRSLPTHLATK
jgi:hypothetical protein